MFADASGDAVVDRAERDRPQDRFGLQLAPAERKLEAVIVDGIRRDPALLLLAHIGRITRGAPAHVRRQVAEILTID